MGRRKRGSVVTVTFAGMSLDGQVILDSGDFVDSEHEFSYGELPKITILASERQDQAKLARAQAQLESAGWNASVRLIDARPKMVLHESNIPGLFDVVLPDGVRLNDLSMGQVTSLCFQMPEYVLAVHGQE